MYRRQLPAHYSWLWKVWVNPLILNPRWQIDNLSRKLTLFSTTKRSFSLASKGFSHLPTNWLLAREDIWRKGLRVGRRRTSWSSAEKWINICLCDEILRLWPLTPQLIWFQQQSTSLKLLSNQKWMALNLGRSRRRKDGTVTRHLPKNIRILTIEKSVLEYYLRIRWFVMLQSEPQIRWIGCSNIKWSGLMVHDGPHVMPSPIFDWILNDVAFARYDSHDFLWGRFRAA